MYSIVCCFFVGFLLFSRIGKFILSNFTDKTTKNIYCFVFRFTATWINIWKQYKPICVTYFTMEKPTPWLYALHLGSNEKTFSYWSMFQTNKWPLKCWYEVLFGFASVHYLKYSAEYGNKKSHKNKIVDCVSIREKPFHHRYSYPGQVELKNSMIHSP